VNQRLTRSRLPIVALIVSAALSVAWSNPPCYPPKSSLVLSATVTGSGHHSVTVQADVTNAQPWCVLRFRIRGVAQDVQADGSGHATTTPPLTVRGDGRIAVTVTTTRKGCTHHESAVTTVIVVRAHVDAPGSVRKGHSFTVHASGFPGNALITVKGMSSHGQSVTLASGPTDPAGNFSASVSLPARDYWVIAACAAGQSDTTYVRVL